MEDAPLCGPRLLTDQELERALARIFDDTTTQQLRDHIAALRRHIELHQQPNTVHVVAQVNPPAIVLAVFDDAEDAHHVAKNYQDGYPHCTVRIFSTSVLRGPDPLGAVEPH